MLLKVKVLKTLEVLFTSGRRDGPFQVWLCQHLVPETHIRPRTGLQRWAYTAVAGPAQGPTRASRSGPFGLRANWASGSFALCTPGIPK